MGSGSRGTGTHGDQWSLEHYFQSHLDIARIVAGALNLADGTPTEVIGDGPRSAIDRVVECVEEIASELGLDLFGSELLADAKVEILVGRFAQVVVMLRLVAVAVGEGQAARILAAI